MFVGYEVHFLSLLFRCGGRFQGYSSLAHKNAERVVLRRARERHKERCQKCVGADPNKRFNNHNYERARGEVSLVNRQAGAGKKFRSGRTAKCREKEAEDVTREV